ncbi:alpha carbonic anhydrase [Mycena sp. CBHHK59/15]|nr:alpha carbonic anhydrase [Mycena sp. CBHHK59/15]
MFAPALALALLSSALSVSANCIHGTSLYPRAESAEGTVAISKFGYSGTQGPLNWAGLDAANSACRTSKVQSPIVLDDSVGKAKSAPKVEISNVEEAEFENLGTTLEVVVSGKTTFEGKEFELKQFHLHTPSEHRINDEYFPLEMHMVHEGKDGSIAVVAIPFQLTEDGSTTELLTSVIENLSNVTKPGTATKTGRLDFEPLVEAIETRPHFLYSGSLTTPPCKEGLTFLVMAEPLALDVKTYNKLKSVIKFNARYSQNTLGETNLLDVAAELAQKDAGIVCVNKPMDMKPSTEMSSHETVSMEKVKTHCGQMCRQKRAFPN